MSQGTRRKFSAEDKAAILRHHLVDKKLVSDVCAEYEIQPSGISLPTRSADSRAGAMGHGRLHRKLLQPEATALNARERQSDRVRT